MDWNGKHAFELNAKLFCFSTKKMNFAVLFTLFRFQPIAAIKPFIFSKKKTDIFQMKFTNWKFYMN